MQTRVGRLPWTSWGLTVLLWALIAVLLTAHASLSQRTFPVSPAPWPQALLLNLCFYSLWALLTPFVAIVVRRFPLLEAPTLRNTAVHMALGLALATALVTPFGMLSARVLPSGSAPHAARPSPLLSAPLNFATYWALVGVLLGRETSRRAKARGAQNAELNERLRDAELTALRLQLHPHFLLNTLHGISAQIQKAPAEADRMVVKLGEFLRTVLLGSSQKDVTLAEEIDFLKGYLDIEETRFSSRLSARFDVDPKALLARVPSLLLQPLAENALRHGLAHRAGPVQLRLTASCEGKRLRLTLEDDGAGLPPDWQLPAREGLGLSNTRQRLKALYGDAQTLSLSRSEEGGLIVTISLPFEDGSSPPFAAGPRNQP